RRIGTYAGGKAALKHFEGHASDRLEIGSHARHRPDPRGGSGDRTVLSALRESEAGCMLHGIDTNALQQRVNEPRAGYQQDGEQPRTSQCNRVSLVVASASAAGG